MHPQGPAPSSGFSLPRASTAFQHHTTSRDLDAHYRSQRGRAYSNHSKELTGKEGERKRGRGGRESEQKNTDFVHLSNISVFGF